MVLLVHKLTRSLKSLSTLENHHPNSVALSASLHEFRSKISNFISQVLLKPEPGPEILPLTWFGRCFDLINTSNMAFAKLVVEIDHPTTRWGAKATDEYLSYTLSLLNLLNSIGLSLSHLNQAKLSAHHALQSLIKNSPTRKHPIKITPTKTPVQDLKFGTSVVVIVDVKSHDPGNERVILEAVTDLKKIGFLALSTVLSGLCGDAKPYMETRKAAGGFEGSLLEGLDLKLCKEIMAKIHGSLDEVREVNCAIDRVSNGRYRTEETLRELKSRLEVMEKSIQGLEKMENNLFSEVLATRNKLLDNLRITGHGNH